MVVVAIRQTLTRYQKYSTFTVEFIWMFQWAVSQSRYLKEKIIKIDTERKILNHLKFDNIMYKIPRTIMRWGAGSTSHWKMLLLVLKLLNFTLKGSKNTVMNFEELRWHEFLPSKNPENVWSLFYRKLTYEQGFAAVRFYGGSGSDNFFRRRLRLQLRLQRT